MAKHLGRPLKYRSLIEHLDDDKIYSPASIVNSALEAGLLNSDDDAESFKIARVRIRHTLARFAKSHKFPKEGDGFVTLRGQALARGWRGKRWKAAMPPKPESKDEDTSQETL